MIGSHELRQRDSYLNKLIGFQDTEPVKVITGIRRCGKSSLLKLMVQHLKNTGVLPEQILEMNFESFDFRRMNADDIYRYVKERIVPGKRMYLFFDELQRIEAWEDAVNAFRVDFDCDIYVTGSNAYLLSSEYSTYLSGRCVEIRMLPLSFHEFLDFHGFEVHEIQSALGGLRKQVFDKNGEHYELREVFDAYIRFGGMPGIADVGLDQEKALSLLAKYATEFGLNAKSGIELSESDPQLSSQDGIRSAIGQGNALFTVSQLARYVGTIANRGTVYNLTLLDKLTDSEGNTIEDYPSSVYNKMEIADVDWNTIQEGLHQVALNTKAFDGLDLTIAGKTGTAQQSKSHPNHALFMGYAPYENPQIALAIRIANGYTSANAAAMASDIFKYYFNLEGKEDLFNGGASQATSEVIND